METTPTTAPSTSGTSTPDLASYLAIHQAIRVSTARLVEGLAELPSGDHRRAGALQRWFEGFSGELQAHHQLEDSLFFPALASRVPSYAEYANTIAVDHHRLDELVGFLRTDLARLSARNHRQSLDGSRVSATDHAVELHQLMTDHLAFEDADVLPMFERHFSATEYAALDEQALKAVKLRQALFTVPWFMATATPQAAAKTLATAPAALRIVHRLTRGRYARLADAAFGPAAGARSEEARS